MSREDLYAPFVEAVIGAAQAAKRPTAKSVITRIARSLLESIRSTANADVPNFVKLIPDDPNAARLLAARAMAGRVVGQFSEINSWRDAWEWLNHAYSVIEHGPARGVEDALLAVFAYVTRLPEAVDFDWLAASLGYSSVEEANEQATS